MAILEEELERTSKYLKRWVKRFVSFNDKTRTISYGTTKLRIKRTMRVIKVTRATDPSLQNGTDADPLAMFVEGVAPDSELQVWSIRMPDIHSFSLWYITLRNSLSEHGAFSSARFTSAVAAAAPEEAAVAHVSPYRDRLEQLFRARAPDKVGQIDKILEEFKGQEEMMLAILSEKYGTNSPSTKPKQAFVAVDNDSLAAVAQRASISSVPVEESKQTSFAISDSLSIDLDEI